MKVSLIGGTGFVGSYLVDALLAAGHTPRLLVRRGHEARVEQRNACELTFGEVADQAAIAECLAGSDAVIYNIGILREFPRRGITFEALQLRGAEQTLTAARTQGVPRMLLMSANGVCPDGTPYQQSKYAAEELLRASDRAWTIFQPSVIFGPPRGRMEFCTQLRKEIIDSPLPAPLFYDGLLPFGAGEFRMSPVAVQDVAQAFVRSLTADWTVGQTLPLGGPASLTWREILTTIAAAVGKRKVMLPAPALGIKAVASLLDRQPWFPVTRDQLTMLLQGNTCDSRETFARLDILPRRFDQEALAYLVAA